MWNNFFFAIEFFQKPDSKKKKKYMHDQHFHFQNWMFFENEPKFMFYL